MNFNLNEVISPTCYAPHSYLSGELALSDAYALNLNAAETTICRRIIEFCEQECKKCAVPTVWKASEGIEKERCEYITRKADSFAARANKRSGESKLNAKEKPNVTGKYFAGNLYEPHLFSCSYTHMDDT